MSVALHVPVLLDEVVEAVAPAAGEVVVDCTLGRGGHARALLEAADCRVVGLDRDQAAIASCREALASYGDRFLAVHAPFSAFGAALDALGIERVDAVLADLGVSSPQLDEAERGFSFRAEGPLDMRMDQSQALTAAEVVNTWSETELADCIYELGEERRSRRVAAAIVAGRPWSDTLSLARAVGEVVGRGTGRIHPATRTFQALRIAVNDELRELRELLPQAVDRLTPGGRLVVIAFHSLEDRIVKRFMATESGRDAERDPYGNPVGTFRLRRSSNLVRPEASDPNPRARSARLRIAVRS